MSSSPYRRLDDRSVADRDFDRRDHSALTAEEMLAGIEGGGRGAAAAQASDGLFGQEIVRPLLHPGFGHAVSKRLSDTEREWILHGRSVDGFRRSQTAVFLGMARKTPYNTMKHCDIG